MIGSTKNGKKRVSFEIEAEPGGEVFVCGTFNAWRSGQYQMKDKPKDGIFKRTITLPIGRHEYKFVVNGEWMTDPDCPDQASNDCGSTNSVIVV